MNSVILTLRSSGGEFDFASIPDLAVYFNAADVGVGAMTSWVDRVNSYDLAGTATRDTEINGTPSVTLNGTTDFLESTGLITALLGASAVTVSIGYKAIGSLPAGLRPVLNLGNYGNAAGEFWIGHDVGAAAWRQFCFGTALSDYTIPEPVATSVRTSQLDFDLATAEAGLFRIDGTPVASTPIANNNNVGQTFGSKILRLGHEAGYHGQLHAMSVTAIVIYTRALSGAEMALVDSGVGALSGIVA